MTTDEFRLTGSDVFVRYCRIEMKRFGTPNEFYIHKCIKSYRSNYYRDVPLKFGEGEYAHFGRCVDVVSVITCGVDEKEVFAVPLDSVEFIEPTCSPTPVQASGRDGTVLFTLWKCPACGGYVYRSNASGITPYVVPNYCQHCGRRLVWD